MASQPHRSLPGPGGGGEGGGGGGSKRRSFLPGPYKRPSGIPTPSSSSIPTPSSSSNQTTSPYLSSQSQAPLSSAVAQPLGSSISRSSSLKTPPADDNLKGGPAGGSQQAQEVIPGAEKLRVGHKIFISGVKPGILRFVGRTHIAPGFWCGIELYDASGLHDGEVDGTRYFTCKPFRGIFAPVDKVVPDDPPLLVSSPPEENRSQVPEYSKYQSSRLSGLARGGAESQEKGRVDSSAFNRRSYGGQETDAGYYKSRMSSSYGDRQDMNRATMSSEEAEGSYSRHVKEHLQSDSRRYFNLTFGRDTPPLPSHHSNNLPDLLSSVSPPSPQGDAPAESIAGQHQQQASSHGAPCDPSDIHLGFDKEGGQVIQEGGSRGVPPSTSSESDASLSGHSSTLEDASVATVHELVKGERRPVKSAGEDDRGKVPGSSSDRSRSRSPTGTSVDNANHLGSARRKERPGSTSGRTKGEGLQQEDGSNEVSPEVSQVLEWDYDHDAFDGTAGGPGISRGLNTEDAARLADRHSHEKPVFDDESEESEEEEDDEEEEEETSEEEEETTSEEEEDDDEEDDDDDEEEESEEESDEEEEEESEDDRTEADRNAPSARASNKGADAGNRVAAPVVGAASGENQGMSSSALVSSEMTESTDTVRVSQKQGPHDTGSTTKPQPETAQKPATSTRTKSSSAKQKATAGSGSCSSQKPKKKRSKPDSAEDKKIVAEHKKAIKSAHSRLADYIKAPLPPPKPKEDKNKDKAKSGKKKSKDNEEKKSRKAKKQDLKSDKQAGGKDEESQEKKERRPPRVREEKPKVKRTVVKSKWGNIMSQIEASKSTVKIKPKAEIQSSLALYLSTPAPPNHKKESPGADSGTATAPDPSKESPTKPIKPKPKLIKHPKPDFSNIKSKLNITPPVQLPRRDSNANSGNLSKGSNKGPGASKGSSAGKPAAEASRSNRANVARKPPVPKFNGKENVEKRDSVEKESGQGSPGTGSCSSLTAVDGNAVSRAGARLRSDRASSTTSTKSDTGGTAQRSVKSMNQRNAEQTVRPAVRSTIPPAAPRKASSPGIPADTKKGGEGEGGARSSASPPKTTTPTPSRPAWGAVSKGTVDQSRSRTAPKGSSPGLKSGHPPDVVSTSARGSRAQEVARLESLCEARTKELSQARMRLKESLQAFDALACLLNYCTNELDAFSCPAISAKLKTATDKLTEQQQSLDRVSQERSQVDQQLQEAQAARDAAQQEVGKLKEEMRQAEETHSAAQRKLQEEQSAAVKALRDEVTSQHQETLQKMQKYQENQTEDTRQSHNRQLVELTSEHQMATNQLKVQHLEAIQELRNKHELQVEELHVQHRKKLEDITDRFESIKLSLTEKVQSLCTECDDLRLRAKSSEDALQRDADVKVQLALTPYLHLPKEIESLKTVIDMRTEEIQKLRRQNMDLVKQLEELPIVQEKVVSLKQKVENLQAIINIKTDHEKQLHEKCQVLMRKYDRESRANKRLSMDYEQVVWRMSQSADFSSTGSVESINPRGGQLSRSPSRGGSAQPSYSHGSSPVRSLSSSSQGAVDGGTNGVPAARRQRKASGGDEQDQRRRANTFSSDTPRHRRARGDGDEGINNGPGSGSGSSKRRGLSKSGDYSGMVSSAATTTTTKDHDHEESFSSSGHESGDTSDFFSSLESNVILETAQGVSFNLVDKTAAAGDGSAAPHDDVFMEEVVMLHPIQDVSPEETATTASCSLPPPPQSQGTTANKQSTDVVTVVVTSPSSQ